MVLEQTNQRKTVKSRKIPDKILAPMLYVLIIGSFALLCFFMQYHDKIGGWIFGDNPKSADEEISVTEEQVEEKLEKAIDFQAVVDNWTKTVGGEKSVLIYDLERDEVVGEYNIDATYDTASLYKLFVVYEGYLRLQSGEWAGEEMVGSTGYTVLECLDLAIRESNSSCAESLWARIGYNELDKIIADNFGIVNSDISARISNVSDIAKMMQIYYEHKDVTNEELVSQIKDSLLNQPATTYDWRQGLPSGFTKANVYNKVGWDYNLDEGYWNIYHDVAIVEFPEENRHFIVVVMTNRVDFTQIRDLGAKIEEYYYNN